MDTLDRLVENKIGRKITSSRLASKAWVKDVLYSAMSIEARSADTDPRITTLEKQVRKLFAEINKIKNSIRFRTAVDEAFEQSTSEELWQRPRHNQLCYVWNTEERPKRPTVENFRNFTIGGLFVDAKLRHWKYWSFISKEDI